MAKVTPGRSDSWAVALVLADSEAHALPGQGGEKAGEKLPRMFPRTQPSGQGSVASQRQPVWGPGCLPHLQMQINGGSAAGVRSLP